MAFQVNILGIPRPVDGNGNVYPSGTLTFYEAGATTTPLTVYGEQGLSTSLGSTITADGDGKFRDMWVNADYRIVLKNSDGVIQWTYDVYSPLGTGTVGTSAIADAAVTLVKIEALTDAYIIVGQPGGNAEVAVTGDVSMANTGVTTIGNNKITYAMLSAILQKENDASIYNLKTGLKLSNNSGTPASIIDVAAGSCSDSGNACVMTLSATTQTDISVNIGSGDGGFPAALTLTNSTWYRVFLVSEADGSNPKLAYDTSATAANALSEWSTATGNTYNKYRRIGWVYYSSSSINSFQQIGNRFLWNAIKNNGTSIAFSTSRTARTVTCPPSTLSQVQIRAERGGTGDTYIMITGDGQTDTAPTSSAYNMIAERWGASPEGSPIITFDLKTTSSSQIYYRCSDVPATDLLDFFAVGWIDDFDS